MNEWILYICLGQNLNFWLESRKVSNFKSLIRSTQSQFWNQCPKLMSEAIIKHTRITVFNIYLRGVPHYKTKSIWRSFIMGWVWMKIQLKTFDSGIHRPPNRSLFGNWDAGIHEPPNWSLFLNRDVGFHEPPNRSV